MTIATLACGDDAGVTDSGGSGATSGDSGSGGSGGISGAGGTSATSGEGGVGGNAGSGAADAGGTAGVGGAAGDPIVTPESALTRFATALCRHYRTCLDDPHDGAVVRALGDEAACVAEKQALLETDRRLGALLSGARAGTLLIRERALETCVDAAERCEQPFLVTPQRKLTYDDLSPCRELFDGSVPQGGACNVSEECAGDAMCVFQEGTSGCNGTCAPRLDEGVTCTVDRECAGADGVWPVCHEQQCLQVVLEDPAAFGEPCGRYQLHRVRPCPAGQYCPNGAIGYQRSCQPFATLDEACDAFTCADGVCLSNVCSAVAIARNEGDGCGGLSICDGFADLYCDFGMCRRASGSDCSQGSWFTSDDCALRTLEPVGAACGSHATCESGVCGFTRGCLAGLCNDN